MFRKKHISFIRTGIILLILSGVAGCNNPQEPGIQEAFDDLSIPDSNTSKNSMTRDTTKNQDNMHEYTISPDLPAEAQYLASLGLVNVQELDSSIRVRLRYSTTDNFLGLDLYGDLEQAYLQPCVAKKLAKASVLLQASYPHLRLLVWDAVRPVAVQKRMWETCDVPLKRRHWYVTPPDKRSLHNYGVAVDICLVHSAGNVLDMGTDFDHFGEEAYTNRDEKLIQNNLVSREAIDNRHILHDIMHKAGFYSIVYEWWHFNSCSRATAESEYNLIMSLGDSTKNEKT